VPTDRVLVEIVTAANMAGVEQAKAGMLGMTPAMLGLAAAMGIVVFTGKAAIDNYKAQETASRLLEQAYATQNDTLAKHHAAIEAFLGTNAKYITDQYDTQTALAQVVRAGNNTTQALRILNDALDLSAIKHVAVSEAANMLVLAEAGNSRGLRFLGITTVEYNEIMKSKLSVEEKDAALLTLVETKTAKGRQTTESLAQSQNSLNYEWQNFTAKIGPNVIAIQHGITEAAATFVGILGVTLDLLQKTGQAGTNAFNAIASAARGAASAARSAHIPGFASGGTVPGSIGAPMLAMVHGGETITPAGGGGGGGGGPEIHIHIDQGAYIDGPSIDILTNRIAQRLRFVTGT
jgi:hypothetical protein